VDLLKRDLETSIFIDILRARGRAVHGARCSVGLGEARSVTSAMMRSDAIMHDACGYAAFSTLLLER